MRHSARPAIWQSKKEFLLGRHFGRALNNIGFIYEDRMGWLFKLLLALVSCLFLAGQTVAFERPNLLVMGDDADPQGVSRDSQVFDRVLNAMNNQLNDIGFDVYDETTLLLEKGQNKNLDYKQDKPSLIQTRRSDADIIALARSIQRPPIDIVVLFTLYASAKPQGSISKVRIRLEGRLLNVRTGQRLGNFEVTSPERFNPSSACGHECLLDIVGDHSKALADNLGEVLAQKLSWLMEDNGNQLVSAFTLEFDNFSPKDMMAIEEYLVVFSGYQSHRPIYNSMTRSEMWYQTSIHSAKLSRNLYKMLDHLNLQGIVQFSGNTYTLQKIVLRNCCATKG